MSTDETWARLQGLAERAVAGDEPAWQQLLAGLETALEPMWRRMPIGRLKSREDDRRNILLKLYEKLRKNEFRALASFFDDRDSPSFRAWTRTVFVRVGIDYQRGHDEYIRVRGAKAEPADSQQSIQRWHELASLHTGAGAQGRPQVTLRNLVRTMLDYVDEAVKTDNRPLYRPALEFWLSGASYDAIAEELGLDDGAAARRIVNAAKELLRRKFASS